MKRSIDNFRGCCHLLRQWNTALRSSRFHSLTTRHTKCGCHNFQIQRAEPVQYGSSYCTAADAPTNTHSEQNEELLNDEVPDEDLDVEETSDDARAVDDIVDVLNKKVNIVAKFRTKDDDPTKHTIEDEGLFYKIPKEEYTKFFARGQWKSYAQQVKTFQECTVMVRRPALEIFSLVDNINLKLPPVKLLLYGKDGSGKSITLAHVVHKYSTEGWLTIHVPDMKNLIRHTPHRIRAHVKSTYNENRYDLTEDARHWLNYFREQNKPFLESITISKDYAWSDRQVSPKGDTLLDITNFGIDRMRFASDVIGVIFKEIKAQAEGKGIKVLVAVEGINGLWRDLGGLRNEQKQLINAQEFSFFRELAKLFEPTWTHGVCVGTVCAAVDVQDVQLDSRDVPYTPVYLLKKHGFEHMDPFIPILVPEFSTKEAYNYIDYLIDRKWIIKPRGMSKEGKKELVMLSNNNPREMLKLSTFW